MQINETVLPPDFDKRPDKTELWTAGLEEFSKEYAEDLENILTSKGVAVAGPFESYEEMTYPQRQRCSYLIIPILDFDYIHQGWAPADQNTYLPEFDDLPKYRYFKLGGTTAFRAALKYEIYEPLTNEKLEIHNLKSDPITVPFNIHAVKVAIQKEQIVNGVPTLVTTWSESVPASAVHKNYHNWTNVSRKTLEIFYKQFMEKTYELLSVEEFQHLDQYKKELEEKKRF
jgi:hypothetical protein